MAPRGRRLLTPRPRLTRPSYGPVGLDGSDGVGGSGGDATATVGGRGGAGVRRGSAGISRCRGRASSTATTIAEECRGAEAAATPLKVSVFFQRRSYHLLLASWSYADQVGVLPSVGSVRWRC